MKTKLLIIPIFALTLLLSCSGMVAHAEEANWKYSYEYYMEYPMFENDFDGTRNKFENCVIYSNWALIAYYDEKYSGRPNEDHVRIVALNTDNTTDEFEYKVEGEVISHNGDGSSSKFADASSVLRIASVTADDFLSKADNLDNHSVGLNYEMTIPLFDSKVSAYNYIAYSDTSGRVNNPTVDWSKEHDFSGDYYTDGIPAPELTSLSHNGFNVFNIEDYYIDIVCESYYYGAKFEKQKVGIFNTGWVVVPDYEWIYNSHYYNFTRSDVAFNNSTINIKEMYNVDNPSALIQDMKNWGNAYPFCEDLPTYKFGRSGSGTASAYRYSFVYDDMLVSSDEERLKTSNCCETVYYVRFYTKNAQYGKWVRYSVRSNTVKKNEVSYAEVEYDDDKKIIVNDSNEPIYDNPTYGKQDISTGITDYGGAIDYENMDLTNFKDVITSMSDSIKDFPNLIAKLFSFLPTWVIGVLGVAITCVVLLRFLGR